MWFYSLRIFAQRYNCWMKKEISLKKDSDIATRGDVKEVVTEVVSAAFEHFTLHILPQVIETIVIRVVDEKLEHFATMVKRSFDHIEAQMVTKDEFYPFKEATEQSFYYLQTDVTDLKMRMGCVENRLDKVEIRLDCIDIRLNEMDVRFNEMDERFDVMIGRFDTTDKKMDEIVTGYYGHNTRLLRLEQKTIAMA